MVRGGKFIFRWLLARLTGFGSLLLNFVHFFSSSHFFIAYCHRNGKFLLLSFRFDDFWSVHTRSDDGCWRRWTNKWNSYFSQIDAKKKNEERNRHKYVGVIALFIAHGRLTCKVTTSHFIASISARRKKLRRRRRRQIYDPVVFKWGIKVISCRCHYYSIENNKIWNMRRSGKNCLVHISCNNNSNNNNNNNSCTAFTP